MNFLQKILFFMLCTFCMGVNSQNIPPRLDEIIKKTMRVNGSLSREIHKEFWDEIRRYSTRLEIDTLKKILNSSVLITSQEYQKEIWNSVKISYQNNQIVKTQRLDELESKVLEGYVQSLPYSKSSKRYREAISNFNEQRKFGIENTKRLLSAAANHTNFTSVQGQVVYLDLNMINSVLTGLEDSFNRVENLFNEHWKN